MKHLVVVVALVASMLAAVPAAAHDGRCFGTESTREVRTMRGNLDGDGVRDEAWVGARRFDGRCRYFLFADTSRAGRSRIRLRAPDDINDYNFAHDVAPVALVRVDAVAGREIAVRMIRGASVSLFRFFTLRQGSLRRMDIEPADDPMALGNLFAVGGGVIGIYGTDCAYEVSPRTVVASEARPQRRTNRYLVVRRWYQVQGHDFVRTTKATQRVSVHRDWVSRRFSEFDRPLGSCAGRVRPF